MTLFRRLYNGLLERITWRPTKPFKEIDSYSPQSDSLTLSHSSSFEGRLFYSHEEGGVVCSVEDPRLLHTFPHRSGEREEKRKNDSTLLSSHPLFSLPSERTYDGIQPEDMRRLRNYE